MANCGHDGEPLTGGWVLQLPVESWVAWCLLDGDLETVTDWSRVENVLAVLVLHPGGYATWMWYVDRYPPPPGVAGEPKAGMQLGEVHGPEWRDMKARIQAEAEAWRRPTT